MNRLEQSLSVLRQYIAAKDIAPWVASPAQERAVFCLWDLGGLDSNWDTTRDYCTYYRNEHQLPSSHGA